MDEKVPDGTQVLNTTDGEVGRIAGWSVVVSDGRTTEVIYDVETQFDVVKVGEKNQKKGNRRRLTVKCLEELYLLTDKPKDVSAKLYETIGEPARKFLAVVLGLEYKTRTQLVQEAAEDERQRNGSGQISS